MPIDIEDLRAWKESGRVEDVKTSERRRFNDPARVDAVIALDETWRRVTGEKDDLRKEFNAASKRMGAFAKQRKEKGAAWFDEKKRETAAITSALKTQIAAKEAEIAQAAADRDALLGKIGNYVHDSVPVFEHEETPEGVLQNGVESTWGAETRRVFPESKEADKDALLAANARPGAGPDGKMLRHHELLQWALDNGCPE